MVGDERDTLAAGAWRLRVLGTADAYPFPRPACRCPQCLEGIERRRSALLVEGRHTALVDAGGSLYQQLLMLDALPRLERVLLTHVHTAHYMGLDELLLLEPRELPLWALDDNWRSIEAAFPYLFRSQGGRPPALVKHIAPLTPDANWLAADEWCTATPVNTYHVDYFTTVGLVFQDKASAQRIGYLPDLRRLDDAGKALLAGAAVVLIDGIQFETRTAPHVTIAEALALCRELDVAQPILTHLGHLRMTTRELRHWLDEAGFGTAQVAQDGMIITIDAGHIALQWPASRTT
jgi:phosphoribosyl 1,2-cyclic phosphodiesterase